MKRSRLARAYWHGYRDGLAYARAERDETREFSRGRPAPGLPVPPPPTPPEPAEAVTEASGR